MSAQRAEVDARYEELEEATNILLEAADLLRSKRKACKDLPEPHPRRGEAVSEWNDSQAKAFGASTLFVERYKAWVRSMDDKVKFEVSLEESD